MDILKNSKEEGKSGEYNNKEATNKTFSYNSNSDDKDRFKKAMVGIVKAPGLAYGMSQSLLEEGIFSVVASPLGPNLCLLKETNEGDMDLLLQDA